MSIIFTKEKKKYMKRSWKFENDKKVFESWLVSTICQQCQERHWKLCLLFLTPLLYYNTNHSNTVVPSLSNHFWKFTAYVHTHVRNYVISTYQIKKIALQMPITNLLILTLQCESLFCEYRISSINSRGYYSFLIVKSAASIRGRLLIKGGYYYKIPKKLREIEPKMDIFGHFTLLLS